MCISGEDGFEKSPDALGVAWCNAFSLQKDVLRVTDRTICHLFVVLEQKSSRLHGIPTSRLPDARLILNS